MPALQRWAAGGVAGLLGAVLAVSAAVVGAGSIALAAGPGGNGIVRAVAHIGQAGLGQAVCPGGDDVLGGGYVAADTDDGQLPVPVVMMPGDLGSHRGFSGCGC